MLFLVHSVMLVCQFFLGLIPLIDSFTLHYISKLLELLFRKVRTGRPTYSGMVCTLVKLVDTCILFVTFCCTIGPTGSIMNKHKHKLVDYDITSFINVPSRLANSRTRLRIYTRIITGDIPSSHSRSG